MTLEVLVPGLRTTLQDVPRDGAARSGIPPSGPADPLAFAAALALVGAEGAAIEVIGPPFTFRCADPRIIAVTGRDVWVGVGRRLPGWIAIFLRPGEEATVGGSAATRYAYLAISGRINVEPVLGSRGTYLPAALGPLPRPLVAGDELPLGAQRGYERAGRRLPVFDYGVAVAAVPGPHTDRFEGGMERAFFAAPFTVTAEGDRMGVRLDGPALVSDGRELLSCGIATGAVQVPRGGRPIVLGPDHQTTGGYPIIATVTRAHQGIVAQAMPGERIRFRPVTALEAISALRQRLVAPA